MINDLSFTRRYGILSQPRIVISKLGSLLGNAELTTGDIDASRGAAARIPGTSCVDRRQQTAVTLRLGELSFIIQPGPEAKVAHVRKIIYKGKTTPYTQWAYPDGFSTGLMAVASLASWRSVNRISTLRTVSTRLTFRLIWSVCSCEVCAGDIASGLPSAPTRETNTGRETVTLEPVGHDVKRGG